MSNLCAKCLTRIPKGRTYCKDCDDSARGMFEKLGYEQAPNSNEKVIEYIKFDKVYETYSDTISIYINIELQYVAKFEYGEYGTLTFKELECINKLIEEVTNNEEC